ncbi:HPP family protein [Marinobacter sp.]|uniref:HPP family protein n=1 Tax=Marinobacter sp. TaxID=50741 RepID=UPI001B55FF00|nr:HPP family protein [Marinobacter sp.]MBQ0833440.1 HPP family protein [Marinobacter sp.]
MGIKNERLRWQLVSGVLQAFHLERLANKYSRRTVMAGFNLVNGGLSIALVSFIALVTQEAFIFPSLGATAFILFYVPMAQPASPKNTLCGHLIGALMGLLALYLFGLQNAPSAFVSHVDLPRVGAAAVSLGLTSCLMVLLRVAHPPAGATALIVSLGLMPSPSQLPILMAGVLVLLVHAFLMNRLSGIPYPLWSSNTAGPSLPLNGGNKGLER